jgi:hypothetical protein
VGEVGILEIASFAAADVAIRGDFFLVEAEEVLAAAVEAAVAA